MPLKRPLTTVLLIILCKAAFALSSRPTSFEDRTSCEESKGVWRQFGNGCADNCEAKLDEFSVCTQSLIYSCECGQKRCWNNNSCVLMSEFEKDYKIKKNAEQKSLSAARKKREALFKANRNKILANFSGQNGSNNQNASQENLVQDSQQIDLGKNRESKIVINNPEVPISENKNVETDLSAIQPPAENTNSSENSSSEVPPLFLQKQAKEQQAKDQKIEEVKTPESEKNTNSANKTNNENKSSSNSNANSSTPKAPPVPLPPGLPEIKLPN